jgi:hypothetical protein
VVWLQRGQWWRGRSNGLCRWSATFVAMNAWQANGLITLPNAMLFSQRERVTALARRHRRDVVLGTARRATPGADRDGGKEGVPENVYS